MRHPSNSEIVARSFDWTVGLEPSSSMEGTCRSMLAATVGYRCGGTGADSCISDIMLYLVGLPRA